MYKIHISFLLAANHELSPKLTGVGRHWAAKKLWIGCMLLLRGPVSKMQWILKGILLSPNRLLLWMLKEYCCFLIFLNCSCSSGLNAVFLPSPAGTVWSSSSKLITIHRLVELPLDTSGSQSGELLHVCKEALLYCFVSFLIVSVNDPLNHFIKQTKKKMTAAGRIMGSQGCPVLISRTCDNATSHGKGGR